MKAKTLPVALLLFVSGTCALTCQVAWMREFRLVFGVSTAATAAVLAIFMGGLGLGNALLGRRVDRHGKPLAFYAWLLLFISVSAAASPFLIDLIRHVYVALGGQTALGIVGASAIRLLLSCAVLGIPTFLMGGTLPAAVKAVTTAEDSHRRGVGALYGLNTLGAVLGAAASTFWMLPLLGTRMTFWLACGLNLLAALGAWLLSRWAERPRTSEPAAASAPSRMEPQVAVPDEQAPAPAALVYAAAATVGFAFFLMEIVWYRMLAPVLGGSTYTFGLILAVALMGIGLGGVAYPLLFRWLRPTLCTLGLFCGLEAVCIVAPYAVGDWIAVLAAHLYETSGSFHAAVLGWTLVTSIVVLPAAVVSGLQFPLLIALLGRGDQDVGKQTGLAFAWNTVGAILGSLAGGFGLLPLLTAPGTWVAVVVVLSLLGFAMVIASLRWERSPARLLLPAALIILALGLRTATGPTAVWRHSAIGAGRGTLPEDRSPNVLRDWMHEVRRETVWEAEGVEASIAIAARNGISFIVNGKSDGSAISDAGTQMMLGLQAAILHPGARTGAVVGLGTGQSAGWLAQVPTIERVDVIELEPAIDQMAWLCAASNHDVLNHPKVRRIYNDAREVLLTSQETYDVIASEPSNPYRAGIGGLYTREFYEICRSRLRQGGLFVQFLQGYEVDAETVCTVLVTLHSVFPQIEVWHAGGRDMHLVCSMHRISHSVPRLQERIAQEPFRSALAAGWEVYDLEGFLAHYIAGNELAADFKKRGAGVVNTDDHNRIEYGFARTVGRPTWLSPFSLRVTATDLGARNPSLEDGSVDWELVEAYRRLQFEESFLPNVSFANLDARQSVRKHLFATSWPDALKAYEADPFEPLFPVEVTLLALAYADAGSEKATALIERLRPLRPTEAAVIETRLLYRLGKRHEALQSLERALLLLRTDPWLRLNVGRSALDLAVRLSNEYPPATARLHAALEKPFALLLLEEARRAAIWDVAFLRSPAYAARATEAFEPHVPWVEGFLRRRVAAYEATDHALLGRAADDLETFLTLAKKTPAPAKKAPPSVPP